MGAVAVVGSVNLDLVFRSKLLPKPGQTLLGGAFATHPGGKGANQAVAIGKLGGDVQFVGCVGKDDEGRGLIDSLLEAHVGTDRVQVMDGVRSGTACIVVADDGSNMIVVAPGANFSVSPAQVTSALGHIHPAVTLCQLEIPIESVIAAAQSPCCILNPAPSQTIPPELLARCFCITPNETEFEDLVGQACSTIQEYESAAVLLLDDGVENVVVTLGSRGCLWISDKNCQHFPARQVLAVDTVAAGDAFNGALAHFVATGFGLDQAIPLANAVAALSTTRIGAQESMPSMAELQDFAGDLL